MAKRNKHSITITDFYLMYLAENMPLEVPYSLYKCIIDDFNTIILLKIYSGSEELKMPFGLGEVSIVKYKPKYYDGRSLSINFKLTRELGKIIYHLNDHSDGYKYRLYWSRKRRSLLILKYSLSFVRANKRHLAQIIKNREHDYIEIT